MHSSSKLAITFTSVIMCLTVLLLADAKLPNTKVYRSPDCGTKSASKTDNKYATHLLDFLVDETKNKYRNKDGSYEYGHSYPDMDSGSASGVGTCCEKLEKMDCWYCLVNANYILNSACHEVVGGNVTLKDCSLSFNKIP